MRLFIRLLLPLIVFLLLSALPARSQPAEKPAEPWEARAIAGFHQAGASGADFTQNAFFDFFIMRGFSSKNLYDAPENLHDRLILWGNVRVASTPQQLTGTVAEFVSTFDKTLGDVKVNQLAQSAEFQTGLEYKLKVFSQGERRRVLGLVGYLGANGTLTAPDKQLQVFTPPAANSLQFENYVHAFTELPGVNRAQLATAKNIALVPPARDRYYRQYGLGMRVSTFDAAHPDQSPGTYTLAFGQDEQITGGRREGLVGRVDVFYPLPLRLEKARNFLYLFGTGNFRLTKSVNSTPVLLAAVCGSVGTPCTTQAFDPLTLVIAVPSRRDTYRLGVGVDFVSLLASWRTH